MFCSCVDSTPAIPIPTPPPFPNAIWPQLCMNLLWKICFNWEEFWLTCRYLWHNIAIDFPNNHILFLNNYLNLLVNHDVPICFSFGERWEHDKVNIKSTCFIFTLWHCISKHASSIKMNVSTIKKFIHAVYWTYEKCFIYLIKMNLKVDQK